ncbi:MAG: YeeE/YedE family protein [Gemmatimonadales bacterium]|jgi:hypothetical protein|nr:YeeE/YedE family protein [Gemmatimonadales bacterium]MDG2240050.1 YeeE/YedE thiosulfate transporter family protein [Longimicrobiales bacterium]NCG31411.1 YeeE/YedE family protein [Pseudomonadota bacterium]MBT3497974.1 YeeE/YedE family protein [Gemmatimonadales bacterium]MBT3775353.1 YeeE/YedE family protein [Gemmatimonadales bacterium]
MTENAQKPGSLVVYFLLGTFLGVVFLKSEVVSWFRIQEMFRFQSIHMYGIIGLAVGVGAISVAAMKKFGTRTVRGDEIAWPDAESKRPQKHHILGGTIFGLGWGLAGACPGPLFALIGSGLPIIGVALLGALVGAWTYGLMKPSLPH